MIDKEKNIVLYLRDEIFDEVLNGKNTEEQITDKKDENESVITKHDDRPKSDIISPAIVKRIQNAAKVAWETKGAMDWVKGSFGTILKQKAKIAESSSEFFKKSQEFYKDTEKLHKRYAKNSIRHIFTLFLRIRAIVRLIKHFIELGREIKEAINTRKPKEMSMKDYTFLLIEDEGEREDLFTEIKEKTEETMSNIITDITEVIIAPLVVMTYDTLKEVAYIIILKIVFTIAKFIAKKIPGIGQMVNRVEKELEKKSKGVLKAVFQKPIGAVKSVAGKATSGVSKAVSKAVKKTKINKFAKIKGSIPKLNKNSITKRVLNWTTKTTKQVAKDVGAWGARKATQIARNATETIRDGIEKVSQNGLEILSMGHMAQEMLDELGDIANSFFGTFTKSSAGAVGVMDTLINNISTATPQETLSKIASTQFHDILGKNSFERIEKTDTTNEKVKFSVDETGTLLLWGGLLNEIFLSFSTQTSTYFTESFFENSFFGSIDIKDDDEVSGFFRKPKEIKEGTKSKKRVITLRTNVSSSIIDDNGLMLDYTNITGFELYIKNDNEVLTISQDKAEIINGEQRTTEGNLTSILKDVSKYLYTQEDIDNLKTDDKYVEGNTSAIATITQFQGITVEIEGKLKDMCHSINKIMAQVGAAEYSYIKHANGEAT